MVEINEMLCTGCGACVKNCLVGMPLMRMPIAAAQCHANPQM